MTAIELVRLEPDSPAGIRVIIGDHGEEVYVSKLVMTKRQAMEIGDILLRTKLIDEYWMGRLRDKVATEPRLHGPMPGEPVPILRHIYILPSGVPHRAAKLN